MEVDDADQLNELALDIRKLMQGASCSILNASNRNMRCLDIIACRHCMSTADTYTDL